MLIAEFWFQVAGFKLQVSGSRPSLKKFREVAF
jgi:hypothetical protein